MFSFLKEFFFAQAHATKIAEMLYQRVVSQARHPIFYRDFAIADSVRGRFEMMTLHLFVVLHRLKMDNEKKRVEKISQKLCDLLVEDMDNSLRDLTISDGTVAKSFKKAMEGFYGRLTAYDRAIQNDDPRDLKEVLLRNVYAAQEKPDAKIVQCLSDYVRDLVQIVAAQDVAQISFEEK